MVEDMRGGPLAGIKVIDFSRLGPGPFTSMILSDFGAIVTAIARPGQPDVKLVPGRSLVDIDIVQEAGREIVLRMAQHADVLIEGFRPGVMERLGLGPEVLMKANPRLVYARLTGWGQSGPYSARAGHDINYLAISGALGASGEGRPVAPPALLGDLACGSFPTAMGIVMALFERERTGRGQLVDSAIVDSAAYVMTCLFTEKYLGTWSGQRGAHILSGAAPFYGVYECSDGGWFSVGAIEPQFYSAFLDVLGFDDVSRDSAEQMRQVAWPALRERVAERFRTRSRDEWSARFAEVDACGAPVLGLEDLAKDEHMANRGAITRIDGRLVAAPAPRMGGHPMPAPKPFEGNELSTAETVLRSYGVSADQVSAAIASGVIGSGQRDARASASGTTHVEKQ